MLLASIKAAFIVAYAFFSAFLVMWLAPSVGLGLHWGYWQSLGIVSLLTAATGPAFMLWTADRQ